MALDAPDERRQSRSIENRARRLAEEIAGTVHLRLETGTGFNRIPAGRRPINQHRAIRIGVIADTHGRFDPVVRRHFKSIYYIFHTEYTVD